MAQEKVEFPITGKITSVNVSKGSAVSEGDVLCLLESMKMENPILAPVGGTVTEINLSVGQVVALSDTTAPGLLKSWGLTSTPRNAIHLNSCRGMRWSSLGNTGTNLT